MSSQKKLVSKKIGLGCLMAFVSVAYALEVITTERYYYVDPAHAENMEKTIVSASPVSDDNPYHKVLGLYSAKPQIVKATIGIRGKQCRVVAFNIKLDGNFMLPKLKSGKKYPHSVVTAFNVEAYKTIEHEKKHRQIYIDRLTLVEDKIQKLQHENDPNCEITKEEIRKLFSEAVEDIVQSNNAFDCYEYGNKIDKNNCKKYASHGSKVTKDISFSSPDGEKKSKSRMQSFDAKPSPEECEGDIIEPFKGKFYCIVGDHKK